MNSKSIEYQKVFPCNCLKKYIEYYWIIKDIDREHIITLMPDVRPSMFFIHKSAARCHHPLKGTSFIDNDFCVDSNIIHTHLLTSGFVGAHYDYMILNVTGVMEIVGVQFTTIGAYAFWGDVAPECVNGIVSADEFPVLKRIEEQCIDMWQKDDIANMFDNCFLELLLLQEGHDIDAFNRLNSVACQQNVWRNTVDMTKKTYIGVRQQERWFKKIIGLSPRKFKVVHRFRMALGELILCNHIGHLEELAYDAGYNDLPHMTRDFVKLCGATPGKLSEYLKSYKVNVSSNLIYQIKSDDNCNICRL